MISQGDIVLVLQGIFEGAMKEINKISFSLGLWLG